MSGRFGVCERAPAAPVRAVCPRYLGVVVPPNRFGLCSREEAVLLGMPEDRRRPTYNIRSFPCLPLLRSLDVILSLASTFSPPCLVQSINARVFNVPSWQPMPLLRRFCSGRVLTPVEAPCAS